MTAAGHAILGTIIAAKIANPALAVSLALASHIATDIMPHWDTATNGNRRKPKRLIITTTIDVLIGFGISFLLLKLFFPKTNLYYAFFMIMVSQSFDWLTALYYFFNLKMFKWVYDFQKLFDNDLDQPWGIITQTIVVLGIFIISLIF